MSTLVERLTDAEAELIKNLVAGEVTNFVSRPGPAEIRGAVLRRMLLGASLPDYPNGVPIPITGIRLLGARITGGIDLADFARPGSGLPSLVFEQCRIEGTFDLTGARIARLSVKDSQFSHIILREAEIDGPFDFSNATPLEGGNEAWIDARDGLFHGQVTGSSANLILPHGAPKSNGPGERRYALWLQNVDIRGSLILVDLSAIGGVSIGAAHIRGNVWLRGARLAAREDDALNGQNARIGGSLVADQGFSATGATWLLGAHFGNSVQLTNSVLAADAAMPGAGDGAHAALILANAKIGTNLSLDVATVTGQILLPNCQIGGDLDCSRLILAPLAEASTHAAEGTAQARLAHVFDATGARVAGSMTLDDAFIRGGLDLTAIDISGKLCMARAALLNRRFGNVQTTALSLVNASIGKDAVFGEATVEAPDPARNSGAAPQPALSTYHPLGISIMLAEPDRAAQSLGSDPSYLAIHLTCPNAGERREAASPQLRRLHAATDVVLLPLHPRVSGAAELVLGRTAPSVRCSLVMQGRVDLTGAKFNGDVSFIDSLIDNWMWDSSGVALNCDRMNVIGNLLFDRVRILGRVTLSAATIGRDMKYRATILMNQGHSEKPGDGLYAKDVNVGSNCEFQDTAIFGNVNLERLQVHGSLSWLTGSQPAAFPSGLAINVPSRRGDRGSLDLGMARIDTALKARNLQLGDSVRLMLGGARVGQLELWWPDGWGGESLRKSRGVLDLDGLKYDRLVFNNVKSKRDATNWLRHHARGVGFSPHPYRQLSTVLRSQGDESGARHVSIVERWRTPQPWWLRPFWYIYGALFGFGFNPAAALITLIVWIIIGTGFVHYAKEAGVLKQSVIVSHSMVSEQDSTSTRSVFPVATGGVPEFVHELPCADVALDYSDDVIFAIDMILPFIPLHQEGRCEISAGDEMIHPAGAHDAVANDDSHKVVWPWRLARAAYTVLGWLFVSLALITFAGVVKRTEALDTD